MKDDGEEHRPRQYSRKNDRGKTLTQAVYQGERREENNDRGSISGRTTEEEHPPGQYSRKDDRGRTLTGAV
jgi:hypothetical protein